MFFRAFVAKHATALGVVGYARNCPDGTVEVVAEGDQASLERLLRYIKEGPPLARVDRVEVEWCDAEGSFRGFVTR